MCTVQNRQVLYSHLKNEKIYILLTEDTLLEVDLWEYSFSKGRT